MSDQLDLFKEQRVTRGDSLRRSAEAKRAARPGLASRNTQATTVLICIQRSGQRGLTRHEIAAELGLPLSSICGRVNELLREERPAVYVGPARRDGRSVLLARGHGAGGHQCTPAGDLFGDSGARSHYEAGL